MSRGPHTLTIPGEGIPTPSNRPVAAPPEVSPVTPGPLTPTTLTPMRTHIGRYELLSRLGAGGMGEVFLARVSGAYGFEKQVVIKRVLPHLSQEAEFVARFIEEGKLVVQLKHASIAQVLDMGEQDGIYFMAMEYVDGRDLGDIIRLAQARQIAIPRPLIIHVLLALLDALDYAHHATDAQGRPFGIIHRDVSPSNVMVSRSGEVKLLDFGIARATERLHGSTVGSIRGKYSYMSPQQAAGGALDARSDLFSVGVIAWELFAGARPFDGASDLLTLDRVRFHEPGPLSHVAPEVTPEISDWVAKMLAKSPEERFPNALSAADELRQIVLSSGELVSSRVLGNWLHTLEQNLPEGFQRNQISGMSLDDLLNLGLEQPSPPHVSPARAAFSPRTPSAQPWAASSLSIESKDGPVLAPPSLMSRKWWQRRSVIGLALANIGLLSVIIWLLFFQQDSVLPTVQVASLQSLGTVPHVPTLLVEKSIKIPESLGIDAGRSLVSAMDAIDQGWTEVALRSKPSGALLTVAGYGQAPAPWTVKVRQGERLNVRATLAGYQPRTLEVVGGVRQNQLIQLQSDAKGSLRFRFFPASGTEVMLNGKRLNTGTNAVSTELTAGEHTIELLGANGRRVQRKFTIEDSKVTNLGTIDLSTP